MKAAELRLGNIISDTAEGFVMNGSLESPICEVTEVYLKSVLVKYVDNSEALGCRIEYSEIEPIPITEEWLCKFGWGKGEFDTQYVDNISLFDDVLCYTVDSNVLHIESSRDCIELNHIKYIHQLQNLYFALTGTELKLTV